MAFVGAYEPYEFSGFFSKIKKQLSRWETSIRKELGRAEQKIRPVVKAVLPVVGTVVGSIVLPGVGTELGATIGGGLTQVGQTIYETEEAKKDIQKQEAIAAQEIAAYQEAQKQAEAEQQAAIAQMQQAGTVQQAGFFSKPSNLLMAGLALGMIAYVPPLKKPRRRRKRKWHSIKHHLALRLIQRLKRQERQ